MATTPTKKRGMSAAWSCARTTSRRRTAAIEIRIAEEAHRAGCDTCVRPRFRRRRSSCSIEILPGNGIGQRWTASPSFRRSPNYKAIAANLCQAGELGKTMLSLLIENGSADLDEERWGRDAVRNDEQLASARFSIRGHIKVCGNLLAPSRECHGAVVMRSAIKDVACGLVYQPD